jgi:dihydropteroate synthase
VTVWSGITAKELSVQMLEGDGSEPAVVMQLNHAAYLGRELVRAEQCLRSGAQYVQD